MCFGEDDHHQIFCAIIIGIKVNFFGQRLAIVIKKLGPERVRGGNGFVAQFFKFEARLSIRRITPAQNQAIDGLAIKLPPNWTV